MIHTQGYTSEIIGCNMYDLQHDHFIVQNVILQVTIFYDLLESEGEVNRPGNQ